MLSKIKYIEVIPVLFTFGVLLTALSPTVYAIGGNTGRLATLAFGLLLVFGVALSGFAFALQRRHLWPWFLMLIVALAIEFRCAANSFSGYNVSWLIFRLICYMYAACGLFFAEVRPSYKPGWFVQVSIGLLAIAGACAWQVTAVSASDGPGRFTFDKETFSPVGLAFIFGLASVVCFTTAIFGRYWLCSVVPLIGFFALLLCMLSTGSRGALVATFLSVGGLTITRLRSLRQLSVAISICIVLVVASAAAFLSSSQLREQGTFVIERFSKISDPGDDKALAERAEFRDYYQNRIENWAFLGDPRYGEVGYPHNLFIEIVVRFGIPIGSLLCFLVVRCFFRSVAAPRDDDFIHNLVSVLGWFSLIIAQFNLSIEYNRRLFCFISYWAFIDTSRSH